jgi:hypothetical protein
MLGCRLGKRRGKTRRPGGFSDTSMVVMIVTGCWGRPLVLLIIPGPRCR